MTAHISNNGLNREESVAEHTRKTTFLCNGKGKRCGISRIMSLCGIANDMGKNKRIFDDYLHSDENTKRKLRGTISHASTGAKCIYDMYHDGSNNTKVMVEMISYAVAAHHGLFDCVDKEHTDIFGENWTRLMTMRKHMTMQSVIIWMNMKLIKFLRIVRMRKRSKWRIYGSLSKQREENRKTGRQLPFQIQKA